MAAPVYNRTMDGPHHKMEGQQEIHPPMGSGKLKEIDAKDINEDIEQSPAHPCGHRIGKEVEFMPIRHILRKSLFGLNPKGKVVIINVSSFPHHRKQVFGMVRTVGILGRVAIGVVHPVEYGISPGREIRTALTNPGKDIEEPFPKFIHFEHLMGSVAVQEEALAE